MSSARSTRDAAPDPPAPERAPLSQHPPRRVPARRPEVVPRHPALLPIAAFYGLLTFAWAFFRHQHYGSSASDLGEYHALLWNVAYHATPWNSIERTHQWTTHLDLGLAPLVLLYRISATPAWLWLAESGMCAAAVFPIDALVRRTTGDAALGVITSVAMLLMPQLVLGQLGDFQPLALAILPTAVMAWAIETDNSRALALGALGALLLREQLGFLVAAAAGLWALRQGKRRVPPAIMLAVLAVGISLLEIFVLLPSVASGQSQHYASQYGALGTGAEGAVRTAMSRPLRVIAAAMEGRRRYYVLEVVSGALPLVLLSFRSLRRAAWPLLLALPPLLVQLLSASPRKWDIHHGYGIPLVAAVAAAAVLSLQLSRAREGEGERRLLAFVWLGLTAVHLALVLPSPKGTGQPIDPGFAGSPRAAALARAVAMVPQDASISAQDNIVPHVATRSEVHRFPDGRSTDDYVLLDLEGPAPNFRTPVHHSAAIRSLRHDDHFEVLVDEAGVILAKRKTTLN